VRIAASSLFSLVVVALLCSAGCSDDSSPSPTDAAAKDTVAAGDGAPGDGAVVDGPGKTDGPGNTDGTPPTPDGGTPTDTGVAPDSGGGGNAKAACLARSAAIRAKTGTVIEVSPAAAGKVKVGSATKTLREVVQQAKAGDIIVLADGTYTFPESTGDNNYTGLYFTKPNVTLRSKSGNAAAVILDSKYFDHGASTAPITVAAKGVVIADLTVKRSIFHLVHLWADGDDAVLHNLRLIDGGQQFVKASPGSGKFVDKVEVTCSTFAMTAAGRDNVWGYGSQTGGTRCYTGGIDTHDSRDWLVADNRFEGIYCNASGVQRPAHGKKASLRNNQTYTGGLAEHAVHMWDSPQGSAHTIERNVVINCARGIGVGLQAEVYGTMVRNNTVFSQHAGGGQHDVGIIIERGHNVKVLNNTVFFSSPSAYKNAIEYRWASSTGMVVKNNLTNKLVASRNNATASLGGNVTNAKASFFVDAAKGDLHLASCQTASVDGKGEKLQDVKDDIDGEARTTDNDVGADQCL
jgi:hypothetical protein